MRFIVLAISETQPQPAEPASAPETERPPTGTADAFERYRNELLAAGVLVTEGRLAPTRRRVRFDHAKRTVLDGPFVETREIVGGYWIWQVASLDDALAWLERAPFDRGEFEVRPVSEWNDITLQGP